MQSRYNAFNPDAIRPARRVYVGGLPPTATDVRLRQFINEMMMRTGGAVSPGYPITSCKVYMDKAYAFLEFRTVEEASNAMAFDGMVLDGSYLKVRRPNNYDHNVAMLLGPTEPNPTMALEGLDMIRTVVADSPDKLFIGGLPCDWSEEQVKDLLLPFGALKAFNLVMDKATGNSKGYAFCEYVDTGLTNLVIEQLNLKPVGSKVLTVKRSVLRQALEPSVAVCVALCEVQCHKQLPGPVSMPAAAMALLPGLQYG
eukprot:jgi/Astpho2/6026/e_gw1.00084.73.1_t